MASIALFSLVYSIYTVKNLSIEDMIEKDTKNNNDTKILDKPEKIIKPDKIKLKES
jgi:hypothetical protein